MDSDNHKKDLESSIPSIEMALFYVSELKKLDLSKLSDRELETIFFSYFPTIPYNNYQFISADVETYRARIDEGEDPFSFVKDIFVRDSDKITNYGRANRPHQQIFYSSSHVKVAATEVVQNISPENYWFGKDIATVTVGVWRIKKPLLVSIMNNSSSLRKVRDDIRKSYNRYHDRIFNMKLSNHVIFVDDILSEFITEQFTREVKEEHDYKISALYSNAIKLLRNIPEFKPGFKLFDGIRYPSVATRYIGDNLAIFMEPFVEGKFELVRAEQVVCITKNDRRNPMVAEKAKSKKIKNGKIEWDMIF
jgi:hypothetical protein